MAELDRLGWAAGVAFRAQGVRAGVRVTDAGALPAVVERLPPGWEPAPGPAVDTLYSLVVGRSEGRVRRFHVLYADSARVLRSLELTDALDEMEAGLHAAVGEGARGRIFLRAGAVSLGGRAILIPSAAPSGKSRLVQALVRAGAAYLSDDFAPLDSQGRVHPYPVPLRLRDDAAGPKTRRSPVPLPGAAETSPRRVALVVLTHFRPGARFRPRTVPPGAALLELLRATLPARRRPARSLEALERLVRSARVIRSPRGEAEEAARSILCEVRDGESG